MSKSIKELQLKFINLESKLEHKKDLVENLYSEQKALLNERFDEKSLFNKYESELNNFRQRLIDLISTNLHLEINQVNELVSKRKNSNDQIANCELEKQRNLNFNKSVIRSEEMCIKRLIMKEFKFSCKFSASQLIKYKYILRITDYLIRLLKDLGTPLIVTRQKSNSDSITLLEYASVEGHFEIVEYLVERGVDVNSAIAIISASKYGHFEILKYLVEHGADVNTKEYLFNNTSLTLASKKRNLEMVKYLVENGADSNAKDQNGWTALLYAAEKGHFDIVKYLVEHGANANLEDDFGWTPLKYVSKRGYLEIVKYLVEKGAIVNATNEWNETALMYASEVGNFEIVKYLVENGADFNGKDKHGYTALMNASLYGHLDIVKYLIENGADANPMNGNA